jgi:hypothetical protein
MSTCCLPSLILEVLPGAYVPLGLLDLAMSCTNMFVLPQVLLLVSLVWYCLARRFIGRTSRGFWRGFAFLSIRGFQPLIRADDAFCCLCMMRCCVLYKELRLLQWLNLSFFVFRFFLLLVALIAVLRHNDTLKAYFCLHLLVWVRHVLRRFWLSSTPWVIVKLFPCSPENLQFLLLLGDFLLCLRLLGWVLDCCCNIPSFYQILGEFFCLYFVSVDWKFTRN